MSSRRALSDRVSELDLAQLDRMVALLIFVEIELQVWLGDSIPGRLYATMAAFGLGCAVALRRRWALTAVVIVLILMALRMLLDQGGSLSNAAGVQIGVILLFYGLGAFTPARHSIWMLAAAVAVTSLNQLTKPGGGAGRMDSAPQGTPGAERLRLRRGVPPARSGCA